MDIKELDKKQLILLTLLITFVVSIATGIVTVSLMNQAPKSVPQTINNVIQRTIEKVTTVETPVKDINNSSVDESSGITLGDNDALVSIYQKNDNETIITLDGVDTNSTDLKELGQGIIISDVGLILVESSILNGENVYKVVLNKTDFDATVLKSFNNGFTFLKITEKKEEIKTPDKTDATVVPQ